MILRILLFATAIGLATAEAKVPHYRQVQRIAWEPTGLPESG